VRKKGGLTRARHEKKKTKNGGRKGNEVLGHINSPIEDRIEEGNVNFKATNLKGVEKSKREEDRPKL